MLNYAAVYSLAFRFAFATLEQLIVRLCGGVIPGLSTAAPERHRLSLTTPAV